MLLLKCISILSILFITVKTSKRQAEHKVYGIATPRTIKNLRRASSENHVTSRHTKYRNQMKIAISDAIDYHQNFTSVLSQAATDSLGIILNMIKLEKLNSLSHSGQENEKLFISSIFSYFFDNIQDFFKNLVEKTINNQLGCILGVKCWHYADAGLH